MSGDTGGQVMMPVPAADAVNQATLLALGAIRDSMKEVKNELVTQNELLRDARERVIRMEGEGISAKITELKNDVNRRCDDADAALEAHKADNRQDHKEFYGRLETLERNAAHDRGFWRPIIALGSIVAAALTSGAVALLLHH